MGSAPNAQSSFIPEYLTPSTKSNVCRLIRNGGTDRCPPSRYCDIESSMDRRFVLVFLIPSFRRIFFL